MITSTLTFAMHMLVSSYKLLGPVGQLLEYVLPYRNMATKAITGKINFNTKHLKRGDPLPPYNGKLRVYNMRYCPFAQRTILALNAKQIDYEVVNINLMDKPEWLTRKSAFAKVPSIEIKEDVCIFESLVTVEYLDEAYPQRPLLPKDPLRKAMDKILIEASGPIHTMMIKVVKMPDSITEDNLKAYEGSLQYIQNELKNRKTKFLSGNEPGYVDYMIWPWFERIGALKKFDERAGIDSSKFGLLLEYFSNMAKDPAVSDYLLSDDILYKYFETYKIGEPNYELLSEQ
ncbi:unnamed protein product [Danaus chrysippus]|uniref:Glutathione-dependent dehydroascorbate reductase n=1 Tax=Danaus chrysippus TaxID=151541 RepID=A0A8J2QEP8_9NEOP|nr:unnamed protein product [Danaus chrysippus]